MKSFTSKCSILHLIRSSRVSQKFSEKVTSHKPRTSLAKFLPVASLLLAANSCQKHPVCHTQLLRSTQSPLTLRCGHWPGGQAGMCWDSLPLRYPPGRVIWGEYIWTLIRLFTVDRKGDATNILQVRT